MLFESLMTNGGAQEDFDSQLEAYPVRLENFEGPLDLLLHLIKKNKFDVYDIPVALITEQYLEYLKLMEEVDVDLMAEFLVMAATLIHIKSRMLLPRQESCQAELDEEDPRDALVRRLLEHQKYKLAAEMFHEWETVRGAQRTRPDERIAHLAGQDFERELEVDLVSLVSAFRTVLERAKEKPVVELPAESISVEQRVDELFDQLSETEACGFDELFRDIDSRATLIVTFLALLEMMRLKLVRVFQAGPFNEIRVYRRPRPMDAPRPIGDPELKST